MPSLFHIALIAAVVICATQSRALALDPVPDTPFAQEYREFYRAPGNEAVEDVWAIAVDGQDRVWIATLAGIYRLTDGKWQAAMNEPDAGPAFKAVRDAAGTVWLGAWNGLYRTHDDGSVERITAVNQPICAIGITPAGVVAMGPHGLWRNRDGVWKEETGRWAHSPKAIACDRDGTLWVPTNHGLFHIDGVEVIGHLHEEKDIRSGELDTAAFAPDGALWVGSNGGLDVYRAGARIASYTPEQGLPHPDVRGVAFDTHGVLWAATACGVARFDGRTWSLRNGLRWLPSDDARDVAFDSMETAWVATGAGVSAIKRRMMTLEDKAAWYHDITMARKVREPGLVEASRLLTPGDVSTSLHEDDDNDGEYTNHYLAMEAFRYAVTKAPDARANAQRAFDAIEFLQTVTGTSGFIARTVVPVSWAAPDNPNPFRFHDANRKYTDRDIALDSVKDPRYKCVEQRWRPSADGQWLWKGDTSSDEITGHFFGYLVYYDLIAETDAEKDRVRRLVRRVMDYLIDGGFELNDIDGTHTHWGVWSPERLLNDPDWRAERPVNCTEMLSYLKTAYHITGDEKYQTQYLHLIDDHGYAEYARAPKPTAPSERTHIDSSLLMLTLPALLKYEDNPKLHAMYVEGLRQWFGTVEDEYSPMYSFVCGALGIEDFGLEPCVAFLRDAPLDLIHWTVDSTKREDIRLVRLPELEPLQTDRMLPASERGVMRWDKNPWEAVSGNGGQTESSGVYWLLPYWLGRYYGFIAAPE